mmetsp:Transcript_48475/g.43451  ORF Transcript_48475/g.43451 Transcript_48475/m.43451 type:complete len:224 (-) Transcript_48475:104-775(-)|eukprot:CAMPEP_0201581840 /NCGR_PEP_ID=MMETSP0190_2-20130828/75794_1 /ASSEMBLY_ACC=CAM_ASM_000263 /TAXON_ID=37353 /ORGANISM="Rosalina sp." /LENGTH=223 /DNA_ID=CAMNT_0048020579 /DNA_START=102 /DNA_END=773 /DNA_ORIENTATION=-
MGFIFSKDKKDKTKEPSKRRNDEMSEKDKASLQVQRQRDRLKKYEKQMQAKIDRETEICKQLLKQKKRDKAKLALRKKKYQMNLLEKARGQLLNIEELIEKVEEAQLQQDVLSAMQTGTDLLQQINSEISLEDAEQLMDDTAEAIAFQEELNQILGGQLNDIDEEDCLKELAQLEQMEADELGLAMPDAPNKQIGKQQDQDKEEVVEEEEPEPQKEKKQVLVQ